MNKIGCEADTIARLHAIASSMGQLIAQVAFCSCDAEQKRLSEVVFWNQVGRKKTDSNRLHLKQQQILRIIVAWSQVRMHANGKATMNTIIQIKNM